MTKFNSRTMNHINTMLTLLLLFTVNLVCAETKRSNRVPLSAPAELSSESIPYGSHERWAAMLQCEQDWRQLAVTKSYEAQRRLFQGRCSSHPMASDYIAEANKAIADPLSEPAYSQYYAQSPAQTAPQQSVQSNVPAELCAAQGNERQSKYRQEMIDSTFDQARRLKAVPSYGRDLVQLFSGSCAVHPNAAQIVAYGRDIIGQAERNPQVVPNFLPSTVFSVASSSVASRPEPYAEPPQRALQAAADCTKQNTPAAAAFATDCSRPQPADTGSAARARIIAKCDRDIRAIQAAGGSPLSIAQRQKILFEGECSIHPRASEYVAGAEKAIAEYSGRGNTSSSGSSHVASAEAHNCVRANSGSYAGYTNVCSFRISVVHCIYRPTTFTGDSSFFDCERAGGLWASGSTAGSVRAGGTEHTSMPSGGRFYAFACKEPYRVANAAFSGDRISGKCVRT